MRTLYDLRLPTIAAVNGAAIGGTPRGGVQRGDRRAVRGVLALRGEAQPRTGVHRQYVISRIGERHARELFLTGRRIPAARAAEIGLVNEAVPDEMLAARVEEWVKDLLSSGPEALRTCRGSDRPRAASRPRLGGPLHPRR